MIFWSGKGFFTVIFFVLGIALTQSIYEAITGLKTSQQDGDLMWACSFLVGAISNFLFAKYLSKKPKRIVIDKESREEFELDEDGTLFFISIRKWSLFYAIISGIFWIRFALGWG